ncbi:MAG: hypothetical protein R2749_24390 [Acidimicrobiales bacterium]
MERAGKHPTIKRLLENLVPESMDGRRLIRPDGKAQLFNGRTGEPYDNPVMVGYIYISEARPPRGRQDPRPVHRPLLDDCPAAARR